MVTVPSANLGSLNRVRPTIVFSNNPVLNIIPAIIGREGLHVTFTGEANTVLPAMVGVVNSPEPYQVVTVAVPIVKTSGAGPLFKSQLESSALLGDCIIRTDSTNMPDFSFQNMSITGVGDYGLGGTEPTWTLTLTGVYVINSNLWNLV